jgi:predicted nucleotidyltransferase
MRQTTTSFERREVAEPVFLAVLNDAVRALEKESITYALMGGVAMAVLGRRWTHDVDIFVRTSDASRALSCLADAGFATQETNPHWLYKAMKDDVLVDILFRSSGDVYLDEEMIERRISREFRGVPLKLVPPEDMLVIKALAANEETPLHWYDALGIIPASDLDWEYVLRRASRGPRRVLSLLVYAQSVDLGVPDHVVAELVRMIYGPAQSGNGERR